MSKRVVRAAAEEILEEEGNNRLAPSSTLCSFELLTVKTWCSTSFLDVGCNAAEAGFFSDVINFRLEQVIIPKLVSLQK